MKKCILAFILMCCTCTNLFAQEGYDFEEEMKLAAPGPEHELLKSLAGSWDMTFKYYGVFPDNPETGSGTVEAQVIIGGRFLQMNGKTVMLGMNAENLVIMGYDRRTNKYTIVGYDSFGTYYVSAAGVYDSTTKTLELFGSDSLLMPGTPGNFKFVFRFQDNDNFIYEVQFETPDKTYIKGIEIFYKRRQ